MSSALKSYSVGRFIAVLVSAAFVVVVTGDHPAAAAPPPVIKDLGAFSGVLDAINQHRASHGAPPLEWDDNAAEAAAQHAAHLRETQNLEHGNTDAYGQNLYLAMSTQTPGEPIPAAEKTAREAVKDWYSQGACYHGHYDPATASSYLEFTQLVWKGSQRIGIAVAHGGPDSNGWYRSYVVADLSPPGNYSGQFEQNVGQPYGETFPAASNPRC